MNRKRWGWMMLIGILYFGIMGAGSCGKKAKTQIGKAEAAMEEAKQAEAPQYAPSEYQSAESSLDSARQQFGHRRYKKAEVQAADAEAKARDARDKALAARKAADEEAARRKAEEDARLAATNQPSLFNGNTINDQPPEVSVEEQGRQILKDVHFAFDSTELSDSARAILDLNVGWLKQHTDVKVELEGHTDSQGTDEYNLALGARRAKAVYDYLVHAGIDPSRLRTISYGESMPIAQGENEEAWAQNRRAHFAVMQ